MSKPLAKWKCDTCGETENSDAGCIVEVFAGEPEYCPISSDECEWFLIQSENKVGDKGQRYQIICLGPDNKKIVVGWSETLNGALSFCEGVRLHPAHHSPKIIDRRPK